MKIIQLCGKAGVGKDTFGAELKKQLEEKGYKCIHIAFADYLKFICQKYFGWDGKKDEKGRKLLQELGTDVIRKTDPNFWVDIVGKLLGVFADNELFDYSIITDARFPNEITRIKGNNLITYSYRIKRKNFVSKLNAEAQQHASETALDDFEMDEIILSGDIKQLPLEVKEFINGWLIF